jgi:transcriptional regulator with XRE-family HTH domain
MTAAPSKFAERLAARRFESGLTQAELAARVVCDPVSICAWETGKMMPNLKYAIRICDVLDCTLDWLTGREARRQSGEAALLEAFRLLGPKNQARVMRIIEVLE